MNRTVSLFPRSGQAPHPEQLKAAIRMRGYTLGRLALENGLSEAAVRIALRRPWSRVERVIADFLGVEPQQLWPDRYQADGTPNPPGWAGHRLRKRTAR